VTATDGNLADSDSSALLEQACTAAASGRRAARALSDWTKRFGLTEAEFQLLWRLRPTSMNGPNQSALAAALAFSPAQVSAVVERVRQRGLICERGAAGDRRRHHWQLSASGRELLDEMLAAVGSLRYDGTPPSDSSAGAGRRREAAA
jgi:DNA-binding MarR family transcriptional regulator